MIRYLVDSSALWQIFRNRDVAEEWRSAARERALHVCEATRTEFLCSAKGPVHRDEMAEQLDALCDLAPVPKAAWRWVETAQYKLTQRGQHRSAGPIDLLLCATAVHHDMTVLHVDNDFAAVGTVLTEVRERDIRAVAG
ncbi:PIN domain-containing protein [Kutzneria chonburiensis]|uniref:Ribonuclease VapC n=1 Tax=Kutzneria chonburiensis TaxID=1483604 RepID=A0ABV6N7A8_9PSEU|nr:PIN domain-containing protein [Kutzneria chonburiensis]